MEFSEETNNRHLTEAEKQQIARIYYKHFDIRTGKLPYGAMSEIVDCIPGRTVDKRTVYKIIAKIKSDESNGEIADLAVKSAGHNPSKQTPVVEALINQYYERDKFMSSIDVHDRLVHAGHDMGYRTTKRIIHNFCDPHHEHLQPLITPLIEHIRMKFVCDEVDEDAKSFHSFLNQIHGDEKAFYMTKDCKLYHWPKGKPLPNADQVQHKSYIWWVMVLLVVAQPCLVPNRNGQGSRWFNGLIGNYAITSEHFYVNGQQHEKLHINPNKTMDAATYTELLERFVFPDIKSTMYWLRNRESWYHHDGASCHRAFRSFDSQAVYDRIAPFGTGHISVCRNPPQSPVMMILDLGLNHSLDSQLHHYITRPENKEDLVHRVNDIFWEYDSTKLLMLWGTLAEVYRQVLANDGKNFPTPHSHVRQRANNAEDIVDLRVNMEDYRRCQALCARHFEYADMPIDEVWSLSTEDLSPDLT